MFNAGLYQKLAYDPLNDLVPIALVFNISYTLVGSKELPYTTPKQVIDAAIQVHGAAALERGHLLEHLYREVRAPRIYEGTSEIQREIIARDLFRH